MSHINEIVQKLNGASARLLAAATILNLEYENDTNVAKIKTMYKKCNKMIKKIMKYKDYNDDSDDSDNESNDFNSKNLKHSDTNSEQSRNKKNDKQYNEHHKEQETMNINELLDNFAKAQGYKGDYVKPKDFKPSDETITDLLKKYPGMENDPIVNILRQTSSDEVTVTCNCVCCNTKDYMNESLPYNGCCSDGGGTNTCKLMREKFKRNKLDSKVNNDGAVLKAAEPTAQEFMNMMISDQEKLDKHINECRAQYLEKEKQTKKEAEKKEAEKKEEEKKEVDKKKTEKENKKVDDKAEQEDNIIEYLQRKQKMEEKTYENCDPSVDDEAFVSDDVKQKLVNDRIRKCKEQYLERKKQKDKIIQDLKDRKSKFETECLTKTLEEKKAEFEKLIKEAEYEMCGFDEGVMHDLQDLDNRVEFVKDDTEPNSAELNNDHANHMYVSNAMCQKCAEKYKTDNKTSNEPLSPREKAKLDDIINDNDEDVSCEMTKMIIGGTDATGEIMSKTVEVNKAIDPKSIWSKVKSDLNKVEEKVVSPMTKNPDRIPPEENILLVISLEEKNRILEKTYLEAKENILSKVGDSAKGEELQKMIQDEADRLLKIFIDAHRKDVHVIYEEEEEDQKDQNKDFNLKNQNPKDQMAELFEQKLTNEAEFFSTE